MNNFLSPYFQRFGTWWQRQTTGKRTVFVIFSIIGTVLCVALLWALLTLRAGYVVYSQSMAAKDSIEAAQVAIDAEDFDTAFQEIIDARGHFEEANESFDRVRVFRLFPQVRQDIEVADELLDAAENLAIGLSTIATLAQEVNTIAGGESSFESITPEQKERILRVLAESPPDLQGARANMQLALLLIEELDTEGVRPELVDVITTIREEVPVLETVVDNAIPAVESVPWLMGYQDERVYMLLLQNNNELRATGGFPGTIGFIKITNGEIVDFYTDNVYNVDDLFKGRDIAPAPEPVTKHTGTKKEVLRNINWEPDFPASARAARDKYFEAGAPETKIDGVVAIDLNFIQDLMEIVGPIEADGNTYTAENFFELLQYEVEFAYYEKGISDADRKEVINTISEQMQEKLFNLPRNEIGTLWDIFEKNSDQRHIQMYVDDQFTLDLLQDQGWTGEMQPYESDYLAIIDSNLAALKTDANMERDVEHSVFEQDGVYYGTATMNYFNATEQITEIYTRYRTHTRFYLPLGSELVSHSGFVTGDRLQNGKPTAPETGEVSYPTIDGGEVAYSVVEGFIAIEPQASEQLTITYTLPESVQEDIRSGNYAFYAQKQAGTNGHGLTLNFDVGKPVLTVSPFDKASQTSDNGYSFQTDLTEDREFFIGLGE
jgi:uncharacterized protein (DUF2164 family)